MDNNKKVLDATCGSRMIWFDKQNDIALFVDKRELDREAVTSAFLSKYYTGVDGADINKTTPTVTGIDHNSLSAVHLAHFKGKDKGQTLNDPR